MSETETDVLHDFRPGVYPGFDVLLKHLTDDHGVPRDAALASNTGLLHRMCHVWPTQETDPE